VISSVNFDISTLNTEASDLRVSNLSGHNDKKLAWRLRKRPYSMPTASNLVTKRRIHRLARCNALLACKSETIIIQITNLSLRQRYDVLHEHLVLSINHFLIGIMACIFYQKKSLLRCFKAVVVASSHLRSKQQVLRTMNEKHRNGELSPQTGQINL